MSGGIESGFKKVEKDKYEPRLLQIKGRRNIRVQQVGGECNGWVGSIAGGWGVQWVGGEHSRWVGEEGVQCEGWGVQWVGGGKGDECSGKKV